jgi:hypothetical protein
MQCRKDSHELTSHEGEMFANIVACLVKARTVKPEKEPLLCNAYAQQ